METPQFGSGMENPQLNNEDPEKVKIENAKELILTNEQYKDQPFAHAEGQRFYVYEISNRDKKLVFFGSPHVIDPADPVFEEIQKKFVETNPDMVYIEGWQAINNRKDAAREKLQKEVLEETKSEGESHFTLKLGVDAGKDFGSPEPDSSEEIASILEKGFSKKDIFSYYMFRMIDQYQREHSERDVDACKEYLKGSLKGFRQDSGWDPAELNVFEQELFADLDVNNRDRYHSQVDPIPWEGKPQTTLNEISRQSSSFRDQHIFETIAEGFKQHNKIFAVYGSAHAVKLEPAFRAFMAEE